MAPKPVCGIAGYSINASSEADRTLVAQTLLAAIAERGADAVGYGFRGPATPLEIRKQRTGASELLDSVSVPRDASEALVHVRDYTKGHPSLAANNHPVCHGDVAGIHNGIIVNDEELFASHGWERNEPGMTVDSEAIFALAEERPRDAARLEELYGAMAYGVARPPGTERALSRPRSRQALVDRRGHRRVCVRLDEGGTRPR